MADLASGSETPHARFIGFARHLRAHGFRFGIGESLIALDGLIPWVTDKQRMRWGLRSVFCGQADDWRRFDELFDEYWHDRVERGEAGSGAGRKEVRAASPATAKTGSAQAHDRAGPGGDSLATGLGAHGGASRAEVTGATDFRWLTAPEDVAKAAWLAARIARSLRPLARHRLRPAGRGRLLHLRRTLRRNLAHGGTPIERVFRRRRRRPPRLVLVLDVSRSMSLYSRIFLRFAGGILDVFQDAYAFAYHTRLVSVTDVLREPDSTRSAEKLTACASGWGGGTRIGACLAELLAKRPGLLHRRTLVMILSDGLDTGPPKDLERALGRIRAQSRRVVWLNPLLGREGYEPLTRGMRAALPYLDLFAPAHDLDSLVALLPKLAAL